MKIKFMYIGNGAFLHGVPNKDLTEEDLKELTVPESFLIESGLYEKVEEAPPRKKKAEIKEITNG